MAPAIETTGLTKRYGATLALDGLDLTVEEGEVFGFLGPNGAGKTTTIRLVLGLQRPSSGRSRVLGMGSWERPVEVHRRVGYLPGDLELYPRLTGRQHVEWFARARAGSRGDAGGPVAGSLVERFGVVMDRPVRELSKGNRQKVGLVLAFMSRPDLLVLDEPTSGLDPLMQKQFEALVRETAGEGRTVFLSSHELDEVQRVADRVAIIKDGKLRTTDTVDALRRRAPQRVEVLFREAPPADAFEGFEGVTVTSREGARVGLQVAGRIGPVLGAIAGRDPLEVTARRADLDELFMQYYVEGSPGGADDAS